MYGATPVLLQGQQHPHAAHYTIAMRLGGLRPLPVPSDGSFVTRSVYNYVNTLAVYRWVFLFLTACVIVPGGILAPRFLDRTTQDFEAPPGSKAEAARELMSRYFPTLDNTTPMMVYVEKPPTADSVRSPEMEAFSYALCARANQSGIMPEMSPAPASMYDDLFGVATPPPRAAVESPYPEDAEGIVRAMKASADMPAMPPVFSRRVNANGNKLPAAEPEKSIVGNAAVAAADSTPPAMPMLVSCMGYYQLEAIQEGQGSQYMAESETSTFLAVVIEGALTAPRTIEYSNWLTRVVPEVAEATGVTAKGYKTALMGSTPFLEVMISAAESDLERMDAIVLPLAFVVLAYILFSFRFVLLTALSLGLSLAISFAILWAVTYSYDIFASVPSLMMSISIAMSIDYSMFLLSRFTEELQMQVRCGRPVDTVAAVPQILLSAGHTIVVSGFTLSMCFFGLLYFQINVMQSLGVGCGVCILIVLICNLFLVPLMLLCFPTFFANGAMGDTSVRNYFKRWCLCSKGDAANVKQAAGADDSTSHKVINVDEKTPLVPAEKDGAHVNGGECSMEAKKDGEAASPGQPSGGCVGVEGIIVARAVPGEPLCREVFSPKATTPNAAPVSPEKASGEEETSASAKERETERLLTNSRWYRLSKKLVRTPYNFLVPLVVIACVVPFGLYAYNYDTTDENVLFLPESSATTKAFRRLGEDFGVGYAFPYQILMVPKDPTAKILDGDKFLAWTETQDIISELERMDAWPISIHDFQGASRDVNGPPLCPNVMSGCIRNATAAGINCANFQQRFMELNPKQCRGNMLLACEYLDNPLDLLNSHSMWVKFAPEFSPMGTSGAKWLKTVRQWAEDRKNDPTKLLNVVFVGGPADALDSMDAVNADYGVMVSITCAIVFVFTCVAFRSLVVGIRSIITIATTITFVYGFATLVYQEGVLTWTTFSGFDQTHAIVYIIPLMSFTILVGISLDYDMFLLTRIVEYRKRGFTTKQAICQAAARTGFLITAAGVIMAIAFSGLFFSEEPYMHQLSFYMVFAVLFDTFIVRTLMVPSLMGLLGEWNWWPGNLWEADAEECAPIVDDAPAARGSDAH